MKPLAKPTKVLLLLSLPVLLFCAAFRAFYVQVRQDSLDRLLVQAVEQKDVPRVERLLQQGASPNASVETDEQPLSFVGFVMHRFAPRARILKAKETPALLRATYHECEPIIRLLLQHGASIKARDARGTTALFWPARDDNVALVTFLLDQGADLEVRDVNGETAMLLAAMEGNTNTVQLLLDRGADVNSANKYGQTALINAADAGSPKTVQLLLARGANRAARDAFGETALTQAQKKDEQATVDVLLAAQRQRR